MRGWIAPLLLVALGACSSQADKQLQAVKSARSVLSEWALVEEQDAKGRANGVYVGQMRQDAKDQLASVAKQLHGQPEAAALLQDLRFGSPDAGALERADSALAPLEKSLEAS